MELAEAFAGYAAVAVANVARYSTADLARHMQLAMKPEPSSNRPKASLWNGSTAAPTTPSPS